MIAKISRGWRVEGLVRYLMGPGRFNEHVGQRVVASWDGHVEAHQPATAADGKFDVNGLVSDLSDPAVAAGIGLREPAARTNGRVPQGPVWHCSLRNAPGDPVLTDEQWGRVVEDLMDRTGIARRGELDGCRWVAIRHADDHVHVAAVLVRQESGRRVHPYRDFLRARETCQAAEAELGLTPTAGADRSSVTGPSQAELEKAQSRGEQEASREWLRRMARVAAVQAQDPEAFFSALQDLGVLVRPRFENSPGSEQDDPAGSEEAGAVVGYSLAAPGDVTGQGLPVWFAGRTLARDLSLPSLVRRWASAPAPPPPSPEEGHRAEVGPNERAGAIDDAVSAMEHATAALAAGDAEQDADGVAHATGDMLSAVGLVCGRQDEDRQVRQEAGNALDRATRVPTEVLPRRWGPVATQLRQAAWRLASVRTVGRRGGGEATRLVLALAVLVAEIAALREEQAQFAQAQAAGRSARVLRSSTVATNARSAPSGPGRGHPARPQQQRPQRLRPTVPMPPAGTDPNARTPGRGR